VMALIRKIFDYYRENGKQNERMARFVDRLGVDNVKDRLK